MITREKIYQNSLTWVSEGSKDGKGNPPKTKWD